MLPKSDHLSRRDVLASGLAAVGTLALGGRWATASTMQTPASGEVKNDYAPFHVGIQSYSLRHFDFKEAMQKIKQLGLHGCESYSKHTEPDTKKATGYKMLAGEMGVLISGFGVSGFSKNHEANRKYFEFGKALGVKYLSADPDKDAFDSLDKLVSEYDIAIGIHPHGPGAKWVKIDQIHDAIKDHHEKIGICTSSAPGRTPCRRWKFSPSGSTASTSRT